MKKVFLFLAMLLFAFTGTMRAYEAQIGEGTSTSGYFPFYTLYNYSIGESLFLASELTAAGVEAGPITSVSWYAANTTGYEQQGLSMWLANVTDEALTTTSHVSTGMTLVYTGSCTPQIGWNEFEFNEGSFEWDGVSNLLILFKRDNGTWNSTINWQYTTAGFNAVAYKYQDSGAFDPTVGNTVSVSQNRPNIIIKGEAGGGTVSLSTNPSPLALGYRPNGAWMAPYVFNIVNTGSTVAVNALDLSGNYFTYNAELPANVNASHPLEVAITTGEAEAGDITSTLTVLYGGNRDAQQFEITATAYDPEAGDVWENAITAPSMEWRTPVTENIPANIYKNYNLPDGTEAPEGVYQVTFTDDVLFYAGTESGSTYLYTEDFDGVGGPAEYNNYMYSGPQVNPGPMALWFNYAYSGTNTWYGTSAGGGFFYGYKISAEVIAENELAGLSITTIETAAREAYPYYCYIFEGGETPFEGDLVSAGVIEDPMAMYFFDINLVEPVVIGNQDIWVIMYSDSPYAGYCGRNPLDTENGKVWTYNPNATSPMWSGNSSYTPVIYCRMLELPTGRTTTMNLADMTMPKGNGVVSEVAEAEGNVMNIAKAQLRNRDEQELTVFPDATSTDNHVPMYVFYFDDFTRSQYIMPATELIDMAGGEITSIKYYTSSNNIPYTTLSSVDIFVKEVASETLSEYIDKSEATIVYQGTVEFVSEGNGGSVTITFNTPYQYNGGNLLIGCENTTDAGYKNIAFYGETGHANSGLFGYNASSTAAATAVASSFLPKTTFTYNAAGGGGGDEPIPYDPYIPDFNCQITDMFVPAGTYYLVATQDVTMAIAEVPAPEPAVIISPSDGQTNVEAPYLAEWALGDYTAEMQVLVGTQYPPQTVLIDWTDYLVESAFLLDLEPNQSYFMQVNARNVAGTVKSEIVAFTTPVDGVVGLEVEETNLYPGDAAVLTWEANRAFKGYNVYKDGVKVNESLITTNTYSVEGLEYNMEGYALTVTAVYDAGESLPSEPVTVFMTGTGTVMGHVYDAPDGYDPENPDQSHPVAGLPVTMIVLDEYQQTQNFEFVTNDEGFYMGEVLAGMCVIGISNDNGMEYGYAVATIESVYVNVAYQDVIDGLDIYTHEYYYPLSTITATEEENDVLVEWSWTPSEMIVDFETGDFSQAEFTLPATYPWEITTTNPHEGTYCMKSTCEGIASGSSTIEATIEVPYDAKMGFWVRVSSETNYDKFHFYIDGVEQGSAMSGDLAYQYKEYTVSEGTHTYKWEYAKDSSVNSNDDCVYVDDITMYRQDVPVPPTPGATVYNFDDDTMMGWTSLDADGDGNGWVSSANPGIYHNAGVSLSGTGHNLSEAYVISGSYANQTGQALTPDNYLISPTQISAQSGASISFYACAQDASYAAEHFGVAVSTGAATAANFTMLQEWTMSAKNAAPAAEVSRAVRGITQGNWYEYTVDLSSYAGQDIWVAIRHFNCTDMFILNVDDITINDGSAKDMRGNRSLMSYNLYRRNNLDNIPEEDLVPLVAGISSDIMSYVDAEWPSLPYGEWQWGIQATYEGYAPVPETTRDVITCGFEDGMPADWSIIDGNNDGYTWCMTSDIPATWTYYASVSLDWYRTGTNAICSGSYINGVGALTPNEYLVMGQHSLGAGSQVSFWAAATDASYPADHFGIFVSDDANDWTSVQEWTLTAKESSLKGGRESREGDGAKLGTWYQYTADLSSYTGTKYVALRHFNCNDQYIMCVDDIELTTSGTPGPGPGPTPPTPGPTGAGLSDIIWSNVIEKDMISTVTFNIALNNGQSPAGAEIELEGIGNENEYEFTMNETGVLETEVRKGEYALEIEMEGYEPIDGVLLVDVNEIEVSFILTEIIAPVANLYVSPTGWAMWEGGTVGPTPGPTPGPGPQPGGDDSFTEDFEGGLNGWNVLTVNADGGEWIHSDDNLGGYDYTTHAHSGSGFAMCYSYVDYVGAFSTDSYMYTPQMYSISNGSTLAFWADNANDQYPENFSVCVATAANPTAADFTTVWSGGAKGTGSNGATVRHADNRYDNWRSHEIDLSAYAGQNVWIAFHDVNYDQYEIWIDDVTLGVANKGDRAALSYKVFLEGEYVGETVNPFYQVPVGGLTEGETYTVGVAPLYATGMGEMMYGTFEYASCGNYNGATEYTATVNGDDVTLTWTVNATPGPGPTPPTPGPGSDETFDFETGMQGWTNIDADGDGNVWDMGTDAGHNSTGYVTSESYINYVGALFPDNYLVSPSKAAYTAVSFWANAQDASYPGEHFGLSVSTAGNTSASDFTTVQEWTMTAKGTGAMGTGRDGQPKAQGNWYEYTVDLSAYAGQEIWVAIRHFDCTDMFRLNVDDVTLTTAAKRNRTVVYEPHFVTDPGAMANGADASWTKNGQTTWGPNINNGGGYKLADDFTLDAATTITEIEVYGYQTGSSTTSTFTGLYAQIYNGAPNAGGQAIWGDETSNIMTSTSFTNCYRGSDGETTATTRPIMAITAENLNIELEAGTYYLVWSLAGSASSGPWAGIEALPGVGNTGNGLQYGSSGWGSLMDSGAGTPYGGAFKLVGEGGGPGPGPGPQPTPGEYLGVMVWRDGEPLTMSPITATTLVDQDVEAGEHEYCIRVVYSDYAMACDQCETVTVGDTPVCDPVINPNGYYMNYQGQEGLVVDWTDPEGVTAIGLYEIDGGTPVFIGNAAPGQHPIFLSFDGPVPACTITLGFVAVYANCESEMVTCDIYYDAVNEVEVVNAIYPNPTSGDLHINATAMTHVTVYNAMGQMVYDQEVSGDELIINMGQYEAGVYMVKVTTETGSSVKRINVVK